MMGTPESTEHGHLFIRYREQGDLRAFETLLEVYNRPLFNYLLRLLRKREEAEDALQEVWCKVIRQRGSYQDQGKFSSWLYRIAHNHCLDQFRRKSHRADESEIVETDEGGMWLERIASNDMNPLEALETLELEERLEAAVQQLSEPIREVYLLRAVQDVPFKEIAEIQNAPLGTVLSRMHQAVKRLQVLLGSQKKFAAGQSA